MLQAPVYGRCVKLTTMTMGLGVKAMLLFEPIWSKTSLQFEELSITEDLAKKLFTKVQRDLDLSERKCKPCIESVRAYDDNTKEETEGVSVLENFSIYLSYQTTKACQEAIIVERLSWLIGKELKLKFGQEHVTMNVSAVPQKEYDSYQYKAGGEAMHLSLHPCNTYQFADFQQFQSCPSVSLNITDYLRLVHMADGKPRKRYINSLFGLAQIGDKVACPSENFTAQVCYESYLSVVRIENHGVTLLSIKIVLVGMGLVSTMFWT